MLAEQLCLVRARDVVASKGEVADLMIRDCLQLDGRTTNPVITAQDCPTLGPCERQPLRIILLYGVEVVGVKFHPVPQGQEGGRYGVSAETAVNKEGVNRSSHEPVGFRQAHGQAGWAESGATGGGFGALCRGPNTAKTLLEADSLPNPFDRHLVVASENIHLIPAPMTLVQYLGWYARAGQTRPAELNGSVDFDRLRLCRFYFGRRERIELARVPSRVSLYSLQSSSEHLVEVNLLVVVTDVGQQPRHASKHLIPIGEDVLLCQWMLRFP